MHPVLEQVDWELEGGAVVELLRALLRFDTTNPPGNEAGCVAFLADHLRGLGVEPEVLSPVAGRARRRRWPPTGWSKRAFRGRGGRRSWANR